MLRPKVLFIDFLAELDGPKQFAPLTRVYITDNSDINQGYFAILTHRPLCNLAALLVL